MKGIIMYSKIQQCKEDGLNKSQTSRELGIPRGTIRRCWDMSLERDEKSGSGRGPGGSTGRSVRS